MSRAVSGERGRARAGGVSPDAMHMRSFRLVRDATGPTFGKRCLVRATWAGLFQLRLGVDVMQGDRSGATNQRFARQAHAPPRVTLATACDTRCSARAHLEE